VSDVATIVADGLELCVCCTLLVANGECCEDSDAHSDAQVAQLGEGREGAAGLVLACDEDCEGWFSWSSCDGCGSRLGGDRHPAVILA
jgi:hypothetical protein